MVQKKTEKQDDPPPEDDGRASPEEALVAIQSLSDTDYARLERVARMFCVRRLRGTELSWEDLLHEAVVKTCDGTRTWRRSAVSIVKHLDRTMESLSDHERERRQTAPRQSLEELESSAEGLVPVQQTFDAQVWARENLETVQELFKDDPKALRVLGCRARGMEGSEVTAELGISKTEHETTSRRILRKLEGHFGKDD